MQFPIVTDKGNKVIVSVIDDGYGKDSNQLEIAAWFDGEKDFIKLGEYDDVVGWLTWDEVNEMVAKIKRYY